MIVGGGPAGLSAALVLGRCRRRVLVCDAGRPRNHATEAVHGFLSRDGIPPLELLRIGREQLRAYQTVELRTVEVVAARPSEGGFEVHLADGGRRRGRRLLLATGVVDELPPIEGLTPLYGTSVHHCPYCDGWEHRDEGIAVYGRGDAGREVAIELTVWTDDVVLCSDGPCGLGEAEREDLEDLGIGIREERIVRLEGNEGRLERIIFRAGPELPRQALFFSSGQHPTSALAAELGAPLTGKGTAATGEHEEAGTPGVYVAGDASEDAQMVAIAAAEATRAALAINRDLLEEDLRARRTARLAARRGASARS